MTDAEAIEIAPDYRAVRRPHIAEWFGHRVFPIVSASPAAADDQQDKRCPFLSQTLERSQECIKQENSRGVCTISSVSNGARQDWLVCPYRALDGALLDRMVRQLYQVDLLHTVDIVPAIRLNDATVRAELLKKLCTAATHRVFFYFQDKLGGEIGLSKTPASPELSFDITVVELLLPSQNSHSPELSLGKYGVIELQTTDTHGSYKHAVGALTQALDLHPHDFFQQAALNPEWAGRKIEGPNISNVFKRTFYQIAFKFQVTKRDSSVGCILAIPQPVWDSWQPFLGAPDIHQQEDGTWRLLDDTTVHPRDWIYVFDIDEHPGSDGGPAPIDIRLIIGTDASTLSRAALDIAPSKAVEHSGTEDAVVASVVRRLHTIAPDASFLTEDNWKLI